MANVIGIGLQSSLLSLLKSRILVCRSYHLIKNAQASKRNIHSSVACLKQKDNDSTYMPKVDMNRRFQGLSDTQQYYVRRAIKEAEERADKAQKKQSTGRKFAGFLVLFSIGSYFFTIYSMKRESKYEGFDVVPPVQDYVNPEDLVPPPSTETKIPAKIKKVAKQTSESEK